LPVRRARASVVGPDRDPLIPPTAHQAPEYGELDAEGLRLERNPR
jgi:hypothetical protein